VGKARLGILAELGDDSEDEEDNMKRWYVGQKMGKRGAFQSEEAPTEVSHGHLYAAVIGPFRTKRAAIWSCDH